MGRPEGSLICIISFSIFGSFSREKAKGKGKGEGEEKGKKKKGKKLPCQKAEEMLST